MIVAKYLWPQTRCGVGISSLAVFQLDFEIFRTISSFIKIASDIL